jgi:DNA replication protein DnaC
MKKYEYYVKLVTAGIDIEYWDLTLDKDWEGDKLAKETTFKIINNLDKFYEDGLSAIFYGNNGTGKSFLSIEILKSAIKKDLSVQFITFAELLEKVKDSFDSESEEFQQYYKEKILDVSILDIDNLGAEYSPKNNTEFPSYRLELLMRYRHRNCLPTIITTNLQPKEFTEIYGSSVNSLISNRSMFIGVFGEDFRLKNNKQWESILK